MRLGGAAGEPCRSMTAKFSNVPLLLVEDDDELREAMALLLEDEGFVVSRACDGVQALRRLGTGPIPAVILLDIMMPNMNGFRFREEQAKVPAYASIPVIALTAGRGTEYLERKIHADAFINKPFDLQHLLESIERLIGANRSC
jgi:CheY-like chemotaxis protein